MSGVIINTNVAAIDATNNLNHSNFSLQKSLNRLSSGFKIITPADDAGGLAVSMKMTAALKRNAVTQDNIANAVSFLQTQDGAMKTTANVMQRISELTTLYSDVTKSSTDKANYSTEFTQLTSQLSQIQTEAFNGVSMFATSSSSLSVSITEDGSQSVSISKANLNSAVSTITSATTLSGITVANTTTAINSIATLRAANGAQTNRLQFASDLLVVNKTNLAAANSRIIDTDIAAESTQFAKFNILVQSGTAMLSQANASANIALRLLS